MRTTLFNISTSRMMRSTLTAGLVAIAFGGFTACSEKDLNSPEDIISDGIEKSGLKVTNDAEYLSKYVTNYKSARSRAADDSMFDFVMGTEPAIPATAQTLVGAPSSNNTINLYTENYGWNLYSTTGEFYIPAGAEVNETLNLSADNLKLYIAGTFNGKIIGNNTKIDIYILDGGAWNDANNDIQQAWSIYKYPGAVLDFAADITGAKGKIYADELITDRNVHFTNGSVLYVQELFKANNITFDSGALFTAHCVEGADVYFTNATDIYISAYINATNLKLDSATKIHMRGAGFINVANYLFCGNVAKEGDGDQFVNDGSEACVISTDYYFAAGSNSGDGVCSLANNLVGNFDFYIKQAAVSIFMYYTPSDFSGVAGQLGGLKNYAFDEVITAAGTNLISSGLSTPLYDSCTAAVSAQKRPTGGDEPGDEPGDDPVTPPVLDPISKVEMDHTHPISATCIDVYGNKAFISWHERGDNMQGCIEVLDVNKDTETVSFEAWLETPRWIYNSDSNKDSAYDFNHLIYDQRTNSIITVGDHPKKGGFVAQIKVNEVTTGAAVGENLNCLIPRQIPFAASGNCVLRNGENLYIAGAGGMSIFPFGDGATFPKPIDPKGIIPYTHLSDCDSLRTSGSAKHLAMYGDKVATIEYTTRTGDTRPARIALWDATSWITGNPTMTTDVPNFGPTYGKDVIAIDNDYIYSCQGTNGVGIYTHDGTEVARFLVNNYLTKANGFTDEQRNKMRNSAANGLCVYGNYIFIANGGAGIWVLDKTDFKPVAHFTDHNKYFSQEMQTEIGASANYVRVTGDGYVYVAYGLAGVMVLKFNEPTL